MYQSHLDLAQNHPVVTPQENHLQLSAARIAEELRPYAGGELAGRYVCLHFNSDSAEAVSQILVMKVGTLDRNWMLPGHLVVCPAEVRPDLAQQVGEMEQLKISERGGVACGEAGSLFCYQFTGPVERLIFRPDGSTDLPYARSVRAITCVPPGMG